MLLCLFYQNACLMKSFTLLGCCSLYNISFSDKNDLKMAQLKNLKAECPYGNEIYAICINPSCRQPAVICQQGYESRDECWNFHDNCMKV